MCAILRGQEEAPLPLYDTTDLAKELGVSTRTVYRRLANHAVLPNEINKNKKGYSIYYYDEAVLKQLSCSQVEKHEKNETASHHIEKNLISFSCISDLDKPKQFVVKFHADADKNVTFCIKNRTNKSYYSLSKKEMRILNKECNKRYGKA